MLSYEDGGERSKMLSVLEAFLWTEGRIDITTAYWIRIYVDELCVIGGKSKVK